MGLRRRRGGRTRRRRGSLGQALVEFALVAPIMVLIIAGLVQFALIFERQIGIENAVRDGARRAATYTTINDSQANTNAAQIWNLVFGTGGLMQSNVQSYDTTGTALQVAKVCYTTQPNGAGNNDVLVTVSVRYKHPLFLPLITQIVDGIDGSVDNALAVSTNSAFLVQNTVGTSYTLSTQPDCFG